jgi:hypothetical protein
MVLHGGTKNLKVLHEIGLAVSVMTQRSVGCICTGWTCLPTSRVPSSQPSSGKPSFPGAVSSTIFGRNRRGSSGASWQHIRNGYIAKDGGRIDLRVAELVVPRTFQQDLVDSVSQTVPPRRRCLCLRGLAVQRGHTAWSQRSGYWWCVISNAELEHSGPLFGGRETTVQITECVGTVSHDTLHADVHSVEPLALHGFDRVSKEIMHHADLTFFHESVALIPACVTAMGVAFFA